MSNKTETSKAPGDVYVARLSAIAKRVLGPGKMSEEELKAMVAKMEQATDAVIQRNIRRSGKSG